MARAFFPAVLALLGPILVACGGEDQGRPSGARAVAPAVEACEATSDYELREIANFESIGRAAGCGSPSICSFYFNHDNRTVTPNQAGEGPPMVPAAPEHCLSLEPAETDPAFGGAPFSTPAPDGARCGTSNGVIRLMAKNIGQCYGLDGRLGWGANLDMKFVEPGNPNVILPLDAGDAEGIGFWIKRASETSNATAMLTVLDEESDAVSNYPGPHCGCLPNGDGTYYCSADPSIDTTHVFPDEAKCDPFGAAFTITDDWSFVAMRFSDLTQKGFGFPLSGLDTSAIRRLQFLVNNGSSDFYIDDISLFRAK
jgi:hypothetical protein